MEKDHTDQKKSPAPPALPHRAHDSVSGLLRQILRVEAEIRGCKSVDELSVLLVNEMCSLLGCRQAYYVELKKKAPHIRKISGSVDLDQHAPVIAWLEKELKEKFSLDEWRKPSSIKFHVGAGASDEDARQFPFELASWFPLMPDDVHPVGGVLVVNDRVIEERSVTIGLRVMSAASHTARVLSSKSPRQRNPRWLFGGYILLFLGVLSLFLPVPMTVLAPMEIVATDAFVVAAPIDGVIESILVSPNSVVAKGDLLIRYVNTVQRNHLELAERAVDVAEAKFRQMQQNSFVDVLAKRELAQLRAELKLKIADRNFAFDTFEKTQIFAPHAGTVVFADQKEWVGKPVVTGEMILEIADVSKIEIRANLPVADIIDLPEHARVRVFLDGDPLNPLEANIYSSSVQAQMVEGQGLVYVIKARIAGGHRIARLGARGTAQLFGEETFLGYYLFRRPLTWMRQRVGL